MSKIIELAKKLKALSDKGVGGEKINAEAMLNALMKKHNITIEQIDGEEMIDYFFNITKNEHPMWYQIVKHINYSIKCYGEFPKKIMKGHSLKGNYMITCTASEYIEIEAKYNFYTNLYKEELDVFFFAFCKANQLLIDNPNRKDKEMSLEDYNEWKRINNMAQEIKVGQFNKQLK